jgi:hypothetical protein
VDGPTKNGIPRGGSWKREEKRRRGRMEERNNEKGRMEERKKAAQ